ncbi:MAG: EAL domain-containing protein [Actinobacteria bacterium]|nr:EAL domain-containing protein [Actinomycetota bacterium]
MHWIDPSSGASEPHKSSDGSLRARLAFAVPVVPERDRARPPRPPQRRSAANRLTLARSMSVWLGMGKRLREVPAISFRLGGGIRVRDFLPRGDSLTEQEWSRRHRVITVLLWSHAIGLALLIRLTGEGFIHAAGEGGVIALLAAGASAKGVPRTYRSALATLGLLSSSALLVHLSGGVIEMHFHFFVVVAVITFYQSWLSFLLAVGYVIVHHGVLGTLAPEEVFNHPAALASPLKWALLHGAFIGALCIACLAAWRVRELAENRERSARAALERVNFELAAAQALAQVGSWDWDLPADSIWWSDELFRITGVDPKRFRPTYERFLELVHPDDRGRVKEIVDRSYETGEPFDYECRIVKTDGEVRAVYARGSVAGDAAGNVVRMFGTLQDVTDRRHLEEQLTHQAFHDALTGLANRLLFTDRVQHALHGLIRTGEELAVMFIDLDEFKNVNDSLGHSAGDELLQEVALRLKGVLRLEDTAARLGGDEFAILIEKADRESATQIAERSLDALRRPIRLQGREIIVNGSIGVAFGDSEIGLEDLLSNADTAMYSAKKRGRNRYEFFEQRMHSDSVRRLELQAELKRALEADEFVLHYQPIYRLDPLEVVGVESLVRWQHPVKGLIPPGEFIPITEETGLIVPLGERILELACGQIQRWNETLDRLHPLHCGVNVSARQLGLPSFTDEVARLLLNFDVHPDQLVLEITESVLMHDSESVAKQLSELTDLGTAIAIDDFGTGYSSLSYLRNFPVRVLKIDRPFVRGTGAGVEESAYARAIVKLGHNLGVDVVAEGIESEKEFQELVAMGCDFGQGFLFAKPMPASELDAILKKPAQLDARGHPVGLGL